MAMDHALPEPNHAQERFEGFLSSRGVRLETTTARSGVDSVLDFFRTQRFSFSGEDWLLFQYGTYDWGAGRFFEFDLTRQFAVDQDDDDSTENAPESDEDGYDGEGMWQLSLTFKFAPTAELESLGSDNCWCQSAAPGVVAEFAEFIYASAAYRAVADAPADLVELDYEDAG